MEKLKIKNKVFFKCIDHSEILAAVKKLACQLKRDYNKDIPVFMVILNGAFMFAADLLKEFDGMCEVEFIAVSSYRGTESTGVVEIKSDFTKNIKNRRVVILEDIVDSGTTISFLLQKMEKYEPKDIQVATLLLKPDALETDVKPGYVGIEVPNDFIVGYGLDYDGYGRNYKDIYKITDD